MRYAVLLRACGRASVHACTHSLLSPHHPLAAQIPETPGEGDKGPRLRPRVRQPPTLPPFLFPRAALRYILQRGVARKRGCHLITGYYHFRARVNPREDGDMVTSIVGQFLLGLLLVTPRLSISAATGACFILPTTAGMAGGIDQERQVH